MEDQGSGGGRLPLALPPASQGCSSGGGGSSAGGSGNPPPQRSLQGLLEMAITAGSEEPDPPPEPMSEEVNGGSQEAGVSAGDRDILGIVPGEGRESRCHGTVGCICARWGYCRLEVASQKCQRGQTLGAQHFAGRQHSLLVQRKGKGFPELDSSGLSVMLLCDVVYTASSQADDGKIAIMGVHRVVPMFRFKGAPHSTLHTGSAPEGSRVFSGRPQALWRGYFSLTSGLMDGGCVTLGKS